MRGVRRLASRLVWLLRPRLPLDIERRRAAARAARAAQDPATLDEARANMAHLGIAPDALDAEAAAYLAFWADVAALTWHPDALTRLDVTGAEHLVAAHEQGRGVLVSFTHHGHYVGLPGSLTAASGVPIRALTSARDIADPGPHMIQHLRVFARGGGLVPSDVGLAGVVERLRAGEALAVATDVPGGSVVELAGRPVRCSSGAVRGAVQAGSPIVVVTARREGLIGALFVHPAIAPVGEVQDLLDRVVRIHEQAVLDWPAAAFAPRLCWAPVEPT